MSWRAAWPGLSRVLGPVYAAGLLRLLVPLIVLPLLASRVGAEQFGHLSFILVWSGLLSTLVEGGFLAAATRLAVAADDAKRWQLAQQIFSARCLLCLPVVALSFVAVAWAGDGHRTLVDSLTVSAIACAVGWPATWYLQATQQLARWARVELFVYAALVAASLLFAHSVAVYLLLQFITSVVLGLLGWRWLRRDLDTAALQAPGLWAPDQCRAGLRLGWTMLPVGLAGAAYSFALPAAASSTMPKAELGVYFMADRIVRAVMAAADPVFSVIYPRVVHLFDQGARVAFQYALRWSLRGAAMGSLLLAAGWILWPLVETHLPSHGAAVDPARLRSVLAVLSLMLPLLLGWRFIGFWMLGSGRFDVAYRRSVVLGGIVGVTGALTAGAWAGALGLAWTALTVECIVIAAAIAGILRGPRAAPR